MQNNPDVVKEYFEKEPAFGWEHLDAAYESAMKVFLNTGEMDPKDLAAPYEDARKAATNPPPVSINDLIDWSILRQVRAR